MAARNHEAYAAAAAASVLDQDYERLELIAIDDCSDDATADVLEGCAAEAPPGRMRVLRHRAPGRDRRDARPRAEPRAGRADRPARQRRPLAAREGSSPGRAAAARARRWPRPRRVRGLRQCNTGAAIPWEREWDRDGRSARRAGPARLLRHDRHGADAARRDRAARPRLHEPGVPVLRRLPPLPHASRSTGEIAHEDRVVMRYRRHAGNLTNVLFSDNLARARANLLELFVERFPEARSSSRRRASADAGRATRDRRGPRARQEQHARCALDARSLPPAPAHGLRDREPRRAQAAGGDVPGALMAQAIVDKVGALAREETLKLDLGCGPAKRGSDYIGVDAIDGPAVDVVGDVLGVLRALRPESVSEVYSSHLFEHIDELDSLVEELERVLARRRAAARSRPPLLQSLLLLGPHASPAVRALHVLVLRGRRAAPAPRAHVRPRPAAPPRAGASQLPLLDGVPVPLPRQGRASVGSSTGASGCRSSTRRTSPGSSRATSSSSCWSK